MMKKNAKSLMLSLLVLSTFTACESDPETTTPSPTEPEVVQGNDNVIIPIPNDPVPTDSQVESSPFQLSPIVEHEFQTEGNDTLYRPVGVGGGGAMSGFSISPYSSLWFVGTDMGTLFRSTNRGVTWLPINHTQTTFSSDLDNSVGVGFSSNPQVVFHAPAGVAPVRSDDAGKTWKKISLNLPAGEKIRYWRGHSYDSAFMYAATSNGLWQSKDTGLTWSKLAGVSGESKGTFIDYAKTGHHIYHATNSGIYRSTDQGKSFSLIYKPTSVSIRQFTAGRDANQITFAFLDDDGESACSDVAKFAAEWGAQSMSAHYANCGFIWTSQNGSQFTRTNKEGGDHLKMAENNSQVLYVTGSTKWIRQYGTKIWKSIDAGKNWGLKLNQLNYDVVPYAPWASDKLEYSAAALDIGWWDSGYESFDMHLRKTAAAGGTGYFFLHTTKNGGEFWNAPFTKFADTGERTKGKKWQSTGLEVTTVYRFKFHPKNPQVGYAAMADVGGMVTEDGGQSFRLSKAYDNSNYDYAFDENDDQVVYAVTGAEHDYPMEWHANSTVSEGGVFKSSNRGRTWTRLTPNNSTFKRQYLSIAFDQINDVLYAGTQGTGIIRSTDRGVSWSSFNNGLPSSVKIIPQIEADPANGDVYALLTGDAPTFSNQTQTGIYVLRNGSSTWQLLRSTVNRPSGVDAATKLWFYPTSFAIDFSSGSDRQTIWLTDYENNKNWLATGVWKSTDGGATWNRKTQYTHPLSITLDQKNPENVFVNGLWQVDGQWGQGGLFYSRDGGNTWRKNTVIAYQKNGRSLTIDPNNNEKVFYAFFGSSMLHGPRPE